ncbi:TPA: hypothetical protein DEP86_01515 [Candidatus Uhrbacteria bacterium]|nr:hypothetical protein [Candidatus Uhrbacteria bacterium]
MKKKIFLTLIMAAASLIPLSVCAQYYSDYDWHDGPTIEPNGPPEIIFPVQGGTNLSDDFGDPRSGGRTHEGNDLMAPKMTPILAARGGRVTFAPMSEPSYGFTLSIAGDNGYEYDYLHINNDTPGSDDGNGGPQYAYAPGITEGVLVTQGQHIAWVGDSGNAEDVGSHLHFEIRLPDGTAINPYPYLDTALSMGTYDVASARTANPTIDLDKSLTAASPTDLHCTPGSLIRIPVITSVYYCGSDGRRYVFPNARVYATWYADFSEVLTISPEEMAAIRIGGNVTYRPGVRLVKVQTDDKVYAVDRGGTLRWVSSPALAARYYGANWAQNVEDIPDVFFINYQIGDPISS